MKKTNIKYISLAIALSLGLGLGSCGERPEQDRGTIQHPQSHDHVMGEGLGEGELEAADDTLERADTAVQQRREGAEAGENRR